MLNINRIRHIVKAAAGLTMPTILNPLNISQEKGMQFSTPSSDNPWGPFLTLLGFGLNPSMAYNGINALGIWDNVKNFKNNPMSASTNILNGGINILDNTLYNKLDNKMSDTSKNLNTFGDMAGSMLPGIAGSAVKLGTRVIGAIDAAGAKRSHKLINNDLAVENIRGLYGSYDTNLANKNFGLFDRKKLRAANREIDRINNIKINMGRIANRSRDTLAKADNPFNVSNYTNQINGGVPTTFRLSAKQGAKLDFEEVETPEIETIDLETKQVEPWKPIIRTTWKPVITYGKGGSVNLEKKEEVLKNVIPEGNLHARLHHMENSDNITKKGIPVVDNEGEQLAEIELNEIIFTLEVTKKLEDLYNKFTDDEHSQKEKDEVAIEAGKLLVEEILFNTDDRTGLIKLIS